jgi:integrase/recombinase XerD
MTPLRQRMTEDMELRGFSRHTQRAYVQYVAIFAQYFHKSPELLGPAKIRAFQLYLIQEPHLSPSSMAVAVTALRFLYKTTLKRDWTVGSRSYSTCFTVFVGLTVV